jgi:hypothetical protein
MGHLVDFAHARQQQRALGWLRAGDWDGLIQGLHQGLDPNLALPQGTVFWQAFLDHLALRPCKPSSTTALGQRYAWRAFLETGARFPGEPIAHHPWTWCLEHARPDLLLLQHQEGPPPGAGVAQTLFERLLRRRAFPADPLNQWPGESFTMAVTALAQAGADLQRPLAEGLPPLELALVHHDLRMANALRAHGATLQALPPTPLRPSGPRRR